MAKTREEREMEACAALSRIEIGERRGKGHNTRHCTMVNRADRKIGSVSTEEWREGKVSSTQTHSLEEWLKMGAAW